MHNVLLLLDAIASPDLVPTPVSEWGQISGVGDLHPVHVLEHLELPHEELVALVVVFNGCLSVPDACHSQRTLVPKRADVDVSPKIEI